MEQFKKDGRTIGELLSGRENNFDFLRLLLAELVIISHSYPVLWKTNELEPLYRATGGQRTLGEFAVDGFFLMSGLLITASWERSASLMEYLKKRVLRIYPGFLAAVAFTGLIVGPLYAENRSYYWEQFDPLKFVASALNLELRSPSSFVNGSLWSIRYEFFCYLGVAAMGLLGMYKQRRLVVVAWLGCTLLYAAQLHFDLKMPGSRLGWLWCFPGFWPRMAAAYLAGVCFYLYREKVICSWKWAVVALLALIIAGNFPQTKTLPLLFPFCAGYLLFYVAFVPNFGVYHIARHGDFSYGLYLYAMPVQYLLTKYLLTKNVGPNLTPTLLTIFATIVTGCLAYLSWTYVERPFLVRKRAIAIKSHEGHG